MKRARLAKRSWGFGVAIFALAVGLAFSRLARASEPVEALEIGASQWLDLYSSPDAAKPIARAEAWGLARVRYEGFVRANAPALILVWAKRSIGGKAWAETRSPLAGRVWIRSERGKVMTLERALKGRPLFLGREWDRKAYSSPGSADALELDDSPDVLRVRFRLPVPRGLAKDVALYSAPGELLREEADAPPNRPEGAKPGPVKPADWASTALSFEAEAEAEAGRAELSLFVYERKDRWAKIRLRDRAPYFGRWAWIETGDGLPEPTAFSSNAERDAAISASPELAQARHERDEQPGFHARLVRTETVSGRAWGLIEAFRTDLCDDGEPGAPAARGWIPLASGDRLVARLNACE